MPSLSRNGVNPGTAFCELRETSRSHEWERGRAISERGGVNPELNHSSGAAGGDRGLLH